MSVLFQRMHIYCFKAKEITLTLLLAFSIWVCDKADKMAAAIDNKNAISLEPLDRFP